jgi:hypothetical protein
LRKLLASKIEATPLHGQQRGYRFRGALLVVRRLVKLLQGLLVVATVAETPAEKGHEIRLLND